MFGLDALCFEYELMPPLPPPLHLRHKLPILHPHNLLLRRQRLLRLYLQLHIILKQLFVLTIVTNSLELSIESTSLSQMVVAYLHVAEGAVR